MNLECDPTVDQLRELIRRNDDDSGHHVLWVDRSGEVRISRLPAGKSSVPGDRPPAGFAESHPDMRLCYETFLAGNEYVGSAAAEDGEWISKLLASLNEEWHKSHADGEFSFVPISSGLFDESSSVSGGFTCRSQ
ncbi:MAG: hypothetical protein WD066_01140 [Planctomycetaceae bacterium]